MNEWVPIKFNALVRLVAERPHAWRWQKVVAPEGPKLVLVTPHGRQWQFRQNRGISLRLMEEPHANDD